MITITDKINKEIASLQKKIKALSGNYLTNTWKRQQEQKSRDDKIDAYQFDIDLLEYIKAIESYRLLTEFEYALITKSFRDMIHQFYLWDKASKNPNTCATEMHYPEIKEDTPAWQHENIRKQIKRLEKVGIYCTIELKFAIQDYEELIESAIKPVDNTQRIIKDLTNKARLQQKGDINFTPEEVAERLVELSGIDSQSKVLEPSAGIGNIADQIKKITDKIDVIERMSDFRELLKHKGHNLVGWDFMEFETDEKYDAVIMNPPFSHNQDIDHLRRAYELVKDGGILISITSPHWEFASDKKSVAFRAWIETQDYFTERLDSGTFEATGVSATIVVIRK